MAKKITMNTIKSFVRKNKADLFLNVRSRFEGMVDGCVSLHDGFKAIKETEKHHENTLGIEGTWFVGSSRDYLSAYEDNTFTGYHISNSCGNFILAIKK